jgi:1-aminocyclopropane-1-carboxylate deaminase
MRLRHLDRATFRRKRTAEVLDLLRGEFGDFYSVPEGGTTVHAHPATARSVHRG